MTAPNCNAGLGVSAGRRCRRFLMALVLMWPAPCWGEAETQAASADVVPDLEIELRLFATPEVSRLKQEGLVLIADLARAGGAWQRAWAITDVNNRKPGTTPARVASATVASDAMKLAIELLSGDRYEITLTKTPAGLFTGAYTSTRGGASSSGGADARVKPGRPPAPPGFAAVAPGEHPRILFRKRDLPALRNKFQSPFGQALAGSWGDACGLGLKHQMTGDRALADQCAESVRKHMADTGGGFPADRAWGARLEHVAVAYDLCCDAWPAEFRREVKEYLLTVGGRWAGGGGSNAHVCSNRASPQYGGAALAGLALWGEPGPLPAEPAGDVAKRFWQDRAAECKRLGGADPRCQDLFERSRQLMVLHYREGIGAGGFHGECAHYATEATDIPARYATAYRGAFGYDVSPDGDIVNWLPCRVMAHAYPADGGQPWSLGINGWQTIPIYYFATLYPVVPEKLRPGILTAWNRQLGVTGPDELVKRLQSAKSDKHGDGMGWFGERVWAFVNYPLEDKPEPLSKCMPLTWHADGLGFYAWRSGWEGKTDAIVQVFAKTHPILGWSGANAGAFRLVAQGVAWTGNPLKREIDRWEENAVMRPDEEVDENGCGRVTHAAFAADGSGAMTIDLTDVYGASKESNYHYTKYGNCRKASAFANPAASGLRAFAVDYSGKCGAPCLLVVVDRIRGGKSKLWTWNLPKPEQLKAVVVKDNTWTLTQGQATLRATFVAPGKATIKSHVHKIDTLDFKKRPLHKEFPLVTAEGGDDFFVVVTVGPSGASVPAVTVEGAGLDAKVRVGGRVIRFDGEKVVIADRN